MDSPYCSLGEDGSVDDESEYKPPQDAKSIR